MNAQPVMADRYIDDTPGPNFCETSGRPNCLGSFIVWADGSTTIVARADNFPLQAHEHCHAIQHAEGRPLEESECEMVQALAWMCPGTM
jgi:hypothetical protein